MNKVFLILPLSLFLAGCFETPRTQIKEKIIVSSPPSQLMDCDRLKKRVVKDINAMTEKEVVLLINNRENIINECFADVKSLRKFINDSKAVAENDNQ